MRYVGRFAPSPTGPLHPGSLFTALASYLDAKANRGRWQLRIDDIDAPRAEPGAADAIQRSLESHGLCWDGATEYQRHAIPRYQDALEQLRRQEALFYCRCSRAMLDANAPYPGTCRTQRAQRPDAAQRLRCDDALIRFNDRLHGPIHADLAQTCGDFVVWRRDGLPAYQLATAVDDGAAQITEVVRGNDLQAITGRQLHIMQLLDLAAPNYCHLPVVVDAQGIKLSKRTGAPALDNQRASANLATAAAQLTLSPPPQLSRWPVAEILAWAIKAWPGAKLQGLSSVPCSTQS